MIDYSKIVEKQIILCTMGKYQLDVEDFFSELDICGYIDTSEACVPLPSGGKAFCRISELKESMWNGKMTVICEFCPDDTASKLDSKGLIYGQDYIYLTDLITVVDETETYNVICNHKDKNVIVMGTGYNCQKLMLRNPHLNVAYFVDNDVSKHGSLFYNRRVLPVEEIHKEQPGTYILIATPAELPKVKEQLNNLGLIFGKDYYCYNANIYPFAPLPSARESAFLPFMEYAPSTYLRKVISECRQFESECDVTIFGLGVGQTGEVGICCSQNEIKSIGNVLYDDFGNIASTSTMLRIVSLSISNNTYRLCRKECHFYGSLKHIKPSVPIERKQKKQPSLEEFYFMVSHDQSCNLCCISCRKHRMLEPDDLEMTDQVHKEVSRIAGKPRMNILATGGEVFYSKYLREIVFEKIKNDKISLFTNGLLFNEQNWQLLKSKYSNITIVFSVDAACKETYRKIRGADWDTLTRNLRFASKLRQKNELSAMYLAFAIQSDNFLEMLDFVKMGEELGVDAVLFESLLNLPPLSSEEYAERRVSNPSSRFYADYCAILNDSYIKRNNVIFLGGDSQRALLPLDYRKLLNA